MEGTGWSVVASTGSGDSPRTSPIRGPSTSASTGVLESAGELPWVGWSPPAGSSSVATAVPPLGSSARDTGAVSTAVVVDLGGAMAAVLAGSTTVARAAARGLATRAAVAVWAPV